MRPQPHTLQLIAYEFSPCMAYARVVRWCGWEQDTRQEQELTTQLRLWRITLQQFNDVFAQENGQNPVDAVEFVSESHLDGARPRPPTPRA